MPCLHLHTFSLILQHNIPKRSTGDPHTDMFIRSRAVRVRASQGSTDVDKRKSVPPASSGDIERVNKFKRVSDRCSNLGKPAL
jgi:hypothetical protein